MYTVKELQALLANSQRDRAALRKLFSEYQTARTATESPEEKKSIGPSFWQSDAESFSRMRCKAFGSQQGGRSQV